MHLTVHPPEWLIHTADYLPLDQLIQTSWLFSIWTTHSHLTIPHLNSTSTHMTIPPSEQLISGYTIPYLNNSFTYLSPIRTNSHIYPLSEQLIHTPDHPPSDQLIHISGYTIPYLNNSFTYLSPTWTTHSHIYPLSEQLIHTSDQLIHISGYTIPYLNNSFIYLSPIWTTHSHIYPPSEQLVHTPELFFKKNIHTHDCPPPELFFHASSGCTCSPPLLSWVWTSECLHIELAQPICQNAIFTTNHHSSTNTV